MYLSSKSSPWSVFAWNSSLLSFWEIQSLLDRKEKLFQIHRFAHKIEGALLDGGHSRFDIAERGEHYHADFGKILLDLSEHVYPVHVGKLQIEQNEVRQLAPGFVQGFLPRRTRKSFIPFVPDRFLQEHPYRIFIVNQKYYRFQPCLPLPGV